MGAWKEGEAARAPHNLRDDRHHDLSTIFSICRSKIEETHTAAEPAVGSKSASGAECTPLASIAGAATACGVVSTLLDNMLGSEPGGEFTSACRESEEVV